MVAVHTHSETSTTGATVGSTNTRVRFVDEGTWLSIIAEWFCSWDNYSNREVREGFGIAAKMWLVVRKSGCKHHGR